MNQFPTIETGIPIPPKIGKTRLDFLKSMEIKQSFVCQDQQTAHCWYMVAKRCGMKVLSRKLNNGNGWRIWRIQ